MEDLFDTTTDKWQKSFSYPWYQRYLWFMALVAIAWAFVKREYLRDLQVEEPSRGWGAVALIALFAFVCLWVSFRAWRAKVVISPTSMKGRHLFLTRDRITWEHIERVTYRWRPFGHTLLFVGTDGAKVSFRSSISGYDDLIALIRGKASEPIVEQLDDLLGEEEGDDAEEPEKPQEKPKKSQGQPPADQQPPAQAPSSP